MDMKDRDKIVGAAVIVALGAGVACNVPANLPAEAPKTGTPTTEFVPASEVDSVYTGQFMWSVDQDVKSQVAKGLGIPESTVGGFTIRIDRSAVNLSKVDVRFGIAKLNGVDAKGQPAEYTQDYLFAEELQNGSSATYKKSIEKNGEQWIEEGIYNEDGSTRRVLEFKADTRIKAEQGETQQILFYPLDESDFPAKSTDKPIAIAVNPPPSGAMVDSATPVPFTDVDVSFKNEPAAEPVKPATPEPAKPTAAPTPILPTVNPEAAKYNTLDINRPLETCPVITDVEAYRAWLENNPGEPFGPNAKLRPLRVWDGGEPPYPIMFDPNTDKDFSDPSIQSFRQSANIVCYKSGQYTYLLFPTHWLNTANRSKPHVTLSGYLYDYGFGTKLTDKQLSQYIKAWLTHKPSFEFSTPFFGGSWGGGQGSENDFLPTQTSKRYPDIKDRMYKFIKTGDAASVSAPGIILEPDIILN
jgi:hypothetical protein